MSETKWYDKNHSKTPGALQGRDKDGQFTEDTIGSPQVQEELIGNYSRLDDDDEIDIDWDSLLNDDDDDLTLEDLGGKSYNSEEKSKEYWEEIYNRNLPKKYYDEKGDYLPGVLENTDFNEAFYNFLGREDEGRYEFEMFVSDKLEYLEKYSYKTFKSIIDKFEDKRREVKNKKISKQANKEFRSPGYIKNGQNTVEDLEKLRNSGKTMSFTQERLKKLMNDLSSNTQSNYSQGFTTYMSPQEFLELTISTEFNSTFKKQIFDFDEKKFNEELGRAATQYLMVDFNTGAVTAHEGRHRMAALMNAGYTNIQILIIPSNGDFIRQNAEGNKIPDNLRGQTFDWEKGRTTSLRIPLNKKELVAVTSGNYNKLKEDIERRKSSELFGLDLKGE